LKTSAAAIYPADPTAEAQWDGLAIVCAYCAASARPGQCECLKCGSLFVYQEADGQEPVAPTLVPVTLAAHKQLNIKDFPRLQRYRVTHVCNSFNNTVYEHLRRLEKWHETWDQAVRTGKEEFLVSNGEKGRSRTWRTEGSVPPWNPTLTANEPAILPDGAACRIIVQWMEKFREAGIPIPESGPVPGIEISSGRDGNGLIGTSTTSRAPCQS
jgi:hypothetical protein